MGESRRGKGPNMQPNWTAENSSWGGDPRRGAALGRASYHGKPESLKFTLKRIRLDSGGYDAGGAYWGVGEKLYWACSDDQKVEYYFRIYDSEVREIMPRDEKFLELYWGTPENGFKSDWEAAKKQNPTLWAYMNTNDKRRDRFKAKLLVRKKYPGATFHG